MKSSQFWFSPADTEAARFEVMKNLFGRQDYPTLFRELRGKEDLLVLEDGAVLELGREAYLVSHKDPFSVIAHQSEPCNGSFASLTGSVCRVCLDAGEDSSFLVAPCRCKGSCGTYHYECLANWLQLKLVKLAANRRVSTFEFGKHRCEVCRAAYPLHYCCEGRSYQSVCLPHQQHSVALINARTKAIHTLSLLPSESISIGRAESNDIVCDGSSISREHALILNREGKYYIKNRNAKFGTCVSIDKMIAVDSSKGLILRKDAITITIEKKEQTANMLSPIK